MRVKVVAPDNLDALSKIYVSARTCYSELSPREIWEQVHSKEVPPVDTMTKLVDRCLHDGHHSVIEHVSVTLFIEGVSRSLSHQLVRHRLASYSQKSQRYVTSKKMFDFVIPPEIEANEDARKLYVENMNDSFSAYTKIYNELYEGYLLQGMPKKDADKKAAEDARYVFPNAITTDLVMTVNLRELIHICNERMCKRAQWEIRELFHLIAKQVSALYPWLKKYLVPKCRTCTERDMCDIAIKRYTKQTEGE